ncbi:MAG: ATP-binding cassette domain-containing protein, partial [Pyrinomonadaceae bacterium]
MFIDVERLSFRYPNGHQVLSDLTFFIDRGCSLAILGPSGCGKSTLLRLLAGLLQDSSMQGTLGGSIRIDGLLPIEYRRKGRVSFMFQEPTLLPHLTV